MENCQCHTTRGNAEQPELTVYKGDEIVIEIVKLVHHIAAIWEIWIVKFEKLNINMFFLKGEIDLVFDNHWQFQELSKSQRNDIWLWFTVKILLLLQHLRH